MARGGSPDDRDLEEGRIAPSRSGGALADDPPERPARPHGDRHAGAAPDHAIDRAIHRQPVRWHDRTLSLRVSERQTLRTVGTFRAVAVADLSRFAYRGDRGRLEADLRSLSRQGLIRRLQVRDRMGRTTSPVVVLSREGRAVATRDTPDQRMYDGLVKVKELAHDSALYRVYQAESARLEREGGRVHRVVLDAELKGDVAAALNRPGDPVGDTDARQAAVAQTYGLRVIDGALQIPDLRIEYETREGDRTRVDLELATEHYKPSQVAAKARAGFTIYAPASQTARLSAALDERGLLTEIFSL